MVRRMGKGTRALIPLTLGCLVVSAFASPAPTTFASLTSDAGPATRASGLPSAACTGWSRIGALRVKGSTQLGGLTGSLDMTVDTRSGRYVTERDYGVYSRAEGFDGQVGWSRDRSGASHDLDSSAARAISATWAWLARRGWCESAAEQTHAIRLPDETEAGIGESAWQVTPPGGSVAILRFDRSSGLPRNFEIRLPFNRLIRHFDDWHRIDHDGVLVAWSQGDEDPEDESLETVAVTSVQVRRSAPPAATFARPPLPADFAILNGASSSTVTYEDDGIGRIYVPVFVDGQGPFAFEVDTGGHLILSEQTAAALHLGAVGNFSNTGAGTGVDHGGLVRTREIRIGLAVIHSQVAKIRPLPEAANDRGSRSPRAGILGLELFERFVVQLDRTRRTLALTPIASSKGVPRGIALPIHFNEDAPLVRGTFDGIAGDFELDSGDAGPAIVEGYWATQQGLDKRLRDGVPWAGSGVGGEYEEMLTRHDLSIGPLKLPHEIVSYVGVTDRGSESTHMQAGVIGESTLRRFNMTYDYGHRQVWIDPDDKVPTQPFSRTGLRLRRDTPHSFVVTFVIPRSPADAAGLRPGDHILAVNSRLATQLAVSDISLMSSGPVGSRLDLLVTSKENGPTQLRSVRLAEMLP